MESSINLNCYHLQMCIKTMPYIVEKKKAAMNVIPALSADCAICTGRLVFCIILQYFILNERVLCLT